jgi:hypothetical protein
MREVLHEVGQDHDDSSLEAAFFKITHPAAAAE